MSQPRFQFTIMGLLWATFWVAVCAAAWTAVFALWKSDHSIVLLFFALVGLATPFIAVGALFGKPGKGLMFFLGAVSYGEAIFWICLILVLLILIVIGKLQISFGSPSSRHDALSLR